MDNFDWTHDRYRRINGSTVIFSFDDEKHVYSLDGRRLWSVTQILDDNGFINKTNFDETSRSRGSAVHHAIALDIPGKLDLTTLHPDLRGYFESSRKFLRQSGLLLLDYEVRAYSPLYMFAGTRDVRYTFQGFEWIGDWKTGGPCNWNGYQTGGYNILAPTVKKMRRRCGIHLKEDGSFPSIVEHTNASDGQYFLAFNATTQARILCGQTKGEEHEPITD